MFNRCNPMGVPWTSVTSNSAFRFSTRQIRMRKLSQEQYRVTQRFIHRNDMKAEGYAAFLNQVEDIQ